MKKLWRRLCFLVVAVSCLSRGQSETVTDEQTDSPDVTTTPPPLPLPRAGSEINATLFVPSTSSENRTSENATHLPTTDFTAQEEITTTDEYGFTEEGRSSTASQTTTTLTVSESATMATASTSPRPVNTEEAVSSGGGYVILVLIILVIIVLCGILYFLRRVSRTYSFDLQRPSPANHRNEPTGTFEPVYLDDLDRPAQDQDQVTNNDLSPPPVANGTPLQSEEKGSSVENAPQQQPDANGLETSSIGDTSPTADNTSEQLGSTTMFFDAIGEEPQNENNNNNPSVCSSDPFVEINLEEPAWSDQLLTSPEVPSSVQPFSPFFFSPSSS